jgi:hypothetical protein
MAWREPPMIFPVALYDVELTKVDKHGRESETYGLFFMNRQVFLGLPNLHPWVCEAAECVGYQSCHGGITYSKDHLPDDTKRDKMWFIGYDYSHYASREEHNSGFSYDKVYDSSCQDEIIQEAKNMMQIAITERVPTMNQEYQKYLIEVLDKIRYSLLSDIVANESKSMDLSFDGSTRLIEELTKHKQYVDSLILSLSEAMEKIAKMYGVLSRNESP